MPRFKFGIALIGIALAAIVFLSYSRPTVAATSNPETDNSISASICPIVFQLDQFPSPDGYRYLFYGNAFFINQDGYLVTAAHVVSAFRLGGQPHILVGPPNGPYHLLEADIVAADWDHDVAILRATPNPFQGNYGVKFLPLTAQRAAVGKNLLLLSELPADPQNATSADLPLQARLTGEILNYRFSPATEKPGTDRELLVVSQKVIPGQSGSPVIDADSKRVIGVVLGQWLRPDVISLATTAAPLTSAPGAVLPIHYAIALLHESGIPWQTESDSPQQSQSSPADAAGFTPATPISLVGTPYPPQALFGGEVVLDAAIAADGTLGDLTVLHGQAPFLDTVLDAVRTWTFDPARQSGRPIDSHVGIVFQFPQSFIPPLAPRGHRYDQPADSPDRAASPILTTEPDYPPDTVADGTVVVSATIDPKGNVASTQVLRDVPALTDPTLAAIQNWHFVPADQNGASTESSVIVVMTFRRPAVR